MTGGCRLLRRATTAPSLTRSRTARRSRRATREAASRSHKTRRATRSPRTRKTTPATAARTTMGTHTWPTTTARRHRSRGRTRRGRERLLPQPHPTPCSAAPTTGRPSSAMVAGAWATAAAPAPHPLTGAPGGRAPSPRVLAPTPHEIQVRLQTSGNGLPSTSLRTWPRLLAPSAAEVVQCRRRRGWPRGREGCSNHSLLPLATTHGPTMAHRSASRTQMHLRVCLWVWPVVGLSSERAGSVAK